MKYFIATNFDEGIEGIYQCEREIKKNDYVVIPDYDDKPITAKVIKLLSRYEALTSINKPIEIIDIVRMAEYKAKREKELDNHILLERMQSKINEIKLLNNLEKFAGQDAEMMELLKEFKNEPKTSVNDNDNDEYDD